MTLNLTQIPKLLEHNGAHILADPLITPDDMLCGFCLRPATSCVIRLRRSPGGIQVDMKKSTCINIVSGRSFRYASAAQSTSNSPCSNVPLRCPLCEISAPDSSVIWKYNMKQHFQLRHPSLVGQNSRLWARKDTEGPFMEAVWARAVEKQKNPPLARKKSKKAPFKISEAHTAMHAILYVFIFHKVRTLDTADPRLIQ